MGPGAPSRADLPGFIYSVSTLRSTTEASKCSRRGKKDFFHATWVPQELPRQLVSPLTAGAAGQAGG